MVVISVSVFSILSVAINATQNSSYYNYTVSAAYDQGSTTGKIVKPASPPNLWQYLDNVKNYVIENAILVATEIALVPASWFILKWWLHKRFRKRMG